MGAADVAVDRAERALRLSPFDPPNDLSYNALAISYLHTRRFAQAYEVATRSDGFNRGFSVSRAFLTAALSRLGRLHEAASEAQQLLAIDPGF